MSLDELKIIRSKIKERVHSWSAGTTSMSILSQEEQKRRLGLKVNEEDLRVASIKIGEDEEIAAEKGVFYVHPPQWDWRSVSNSNWTTSVKDQGDCGACVAFAVIGTIESCLKISKRDPIYSPDLSEADLFFGGCDNCCTRGWDYVSALNYAHANGVADEACYPYNGEGPCPDRESRLVKIDSWRAIFGVSEAKEWICTRGPVMTGMHVCSDFYYYRGGVYAHEYGDALGTHAICIIGFDEPAGYWICKNCWGMEWGESGWFKIAYGECGIGSSFPFYTAELPAE
jgi:C1A family cysteine protease